HLIFATNFSETCHAAIPTVAQLVDRLRARLTILHVHAKGKRAQAVHQLRHGRDGGMAGLGKIGGKDQV
ncbi:hypothetical protein XarbCFBP8150_21555, partial [Xanthomonas arboricola]